MMKYSSRGLRLSFKVVLTDEVREFGGGEILWTSQVSSVENIVLVATGAEEDIRTSPIVYPDFSISSCNFDPVCRVKFSLMSFIPLPPGVLGMTVMTKDLNICHVESKDV